MNETTQPAVAGPVERGVRPRAWQWLNTGILRKKLPLTAEPGAWTPLYDQAALDAAVAAERERCANLCDQAARGYQERGMDLAYAASEWIAAAIREA